MASTFHHGLRAPGPFGTLLAITLVGGAVAACVAACSASNNASSSGAGASSGGEGGAGGTTFATGGGGEGELGCTGDLHGVTLNGLVIEECPPDQGCADGACVPVCEAAASSKGNIGCDFYAADPPFTENGQGEPAYDGSCYAVFVANTWPLPAKLTVSRGSQTFDVTQFAYLSSGIVSDITYTPVPDEGIPPNQVAVLFLSQAAATNYECPMPPALAADAAAQGSTRGSAFRLVSDVPVTVYDVLPYGGVNSLLPSASLLFPETAWGTNYYVVAPHTDDAGGSLWAMLVGSVDGTEVKIAPLVTLPGGAGVAAAPAFEVTSYTLNAGETLQWVGGDPSGSVIQATQPIAVVTGSTYLKVVTSTSPNGGGQDAAHQQIPHINALGSEYVGTNFVTRLETLTPERVPYRLIGVVDGTQLTWEPSIPSNAPVTLGAGQVAEFDTDALFVVHSQDADHPFGFTQYMAGTPGTSARLDGCSTDYPDYCPLGDPEWVNLLPPQQFLQHYAFFIDPTYGTTNLVITRVKGDSGFKDVVIDCLGGPVTDWIPVGSSGNYEIAYVDLVRATTPVAQCDGSLVDATSDGRFGVVVWGTDSTASYAYPGGGNIGAINEVVVVPTPP